MSVEKEYRFRVKEHERVIILAALRDYVRALEMLMELHENPEFKGLEGKIPLPEREGVEIILSETIKLYSRISRASRGRVKET
jgi:hypothetical protein